MIRRIIFFCILLFSASICFSQKIPLINSGEVIASGKVQYDSGNYAKAILEFLKVPERDTNYHVMLPELATAYNADKQYDKALETCAAGMKSPGQQKARLLKIEAFATGRKGDFKKSIELFEKAIEKYPFDLSLQFNMGVTYSNNKDYEKAKSIFFKILSMNPFFQGCHLQLAQIAIIQGQKTHGMLSLGLYLGINNTDNPRLVLLNNFVTNQVEDEATVPPTGFNACEKLDQIIRSKISMDDKFKSQFPVKVAVFRQFETLFAQLATLNTEGDDPWLKFYLPVYRLIRDENLILPFIYHVTSSSDIDAVRKWRSKNQKSLDTFFGRVNDKLHEKRAKIQAKSLGFTDDVSAWYDEQNFLEGIGEKSGDLRVGAWYYLHPNGEMWAEGKYDDKGEKSGTWKYYAKDGSIKSIENYDTGEITLYYPNGNKREYFYLKDELTEGTVDIFFDCGGLKEKIAYTAGKRNGKGVMYYASGKPEMTYQYENDNATGEFLSYYQNGKLYSKAFYKDDMLDGQYNSYYSNGNTMKEGNYVGGKLDGVWKKYLSNGKLQSSGAYVKGVAVGDWLFYDPDGSISEKRIFNDEGEFHGENTFYTNGKVRAIYTYKKDLLTKIVCYDTQGKELSKAGAENGSFSGRTHYQTGQVLSEFSYKKGKLNGTVKYYYRNGQLKNEIEYVNGLSQGPAVEFHESGEKKLDMVYVNDELHGYFIEYYPHGQIKQEGWFQNGVREQQWLEYHPDGTLDTDYFYVRGATHGKGYHYAGDGKIFQVVNYDGDRIKDLEYYDPNNTLISGKRTDKGVDVFESHYKNKKLKAAFPSICGYYDGNLMQWYSNGNLFYSYAMTDGKRNGDYVLNFVNGKTITKGKFLDDERFGHWYIYEDDGSLSSEGNYLDGERDSVWLFYYRNGKISTRTNFLKDERHGISTYYAPDGTVLMEKMLENDDIIAYRTAGPNNTWSGWITFNGNEKIELKYPDGTLAYVEGYQDGLRHGSRNSYYPNGKPCEVYNFVKGIQQGPYEIYFANGKLQEKGAFNHDELDGKVETFNEDGTVSKTEEFKFAVRNGKTIIYTKGVKKEYNFWAGTTVD